MLLSASFDCVYASTLHLNATYDQSIPTLLAEDYYQIGGVIELWSVDENGVPSVSDTSRISQHLSPQQVIDILNGDAEIPLESNKWYNSDYAEIFLGLGACVGYESNSLSYESFYGIGASYDANSTIQVHEIGSIGGLSGEITGFNYGYKIHFRDTGWEQGLIPGILSYSIEYEPVPVPVPEPATVLLLFTAGIIGLAAVKKGSGKRST